MSDKPITYAEAFAQVLGPVDGPISVNELIDKVLEIRPSTAKKPRAAVRKHIRESSREQKLVYLDQKTLLPMRIAMRGIRFATPLSRREVKRGVFIIGSAFTGFLHRDITTENIRFYDEQGRPLPGRIVHLKETVQSIYGPSTIETPAFDLADWYRAHNVQRDDTLLITIKDWDLGHFQIAHEPSRQRKRNRAEIAAWNRAFSDIVFDMLESAHNEYIYVSEAIPTAYMRLPDPYGYPGDHWISVIQDDPRMRCDGWRIQYSDWQSPLERMFEDVMEEQSPQPATPVELSPAQAQQVYRFKAALQYRKGLWRRIEIQGEDTFWDFDHILRDAFGHDSMDHLGGFWRRVRRGKSRRFREIELATVYPFGEEGQGQNIPIGALDLQPDDTLKYVYDFGDWIEHLLTLEAVAEPEDDALYPRIVARNRPRYRYCEHCEAEGRKTVATFICIECSNDRQEEVLVCEDCLIKHHEDHYAEEILY